jgi:hypothetical protein
MQSHWDYYRFVYAEESRFLWAFLLFVLGVIALPEQWVGPVFIGLAVVSLGALLVDVGRIAAKWRSVQFLPRERPFQLRETRPQPRDAVQWVPEEPHLVATGNQPGPRAAEIWFDAAVDRALQAQSPAARMAGATIRPAEARLSRHRYEMPYALAAGAAMALRVDRNTTERRRLPIRFNGRLLRLATEPTVAQLVNGDLGLEPVTYFDGESTNEIWRLATTEDPGTSPVQDHVLDRSGRIRALENSRAANIIGISIVAVTADEQVVFVQQTHGNSIAPGALAASGSGSLEQADLDGRRAGWLPWRRQHSQPRKALTDLVLHGMLRELREESLVRPDEILTETAVVTGYFRWIDRAMKPEFTGLVRLTCTAAELGLRRQRGGERAFTQRAISVPLTQLLDSPDSPVRVHASATPNYEEVSAGLGGALSRYIASERLLTDGPRVLMSPSAEHAWYATARYLAAEQWWMAAGDRAADQGRTSKSP